MLTPKQERNGVGPAVVGHNTAVPGPDVTAEIAARIGQSESLGMERNTADMYGKPAGTEGVVDWESGVATGDLPGEA